MGKARFITAVILVGLFEYNAINGNWTKVFAIIGVGIIIELYEIAEALRNIIEHKKESNEKSSEQEK